MDKFEKLYRKLNNLINQENDYIESLQVDKLKEAIEKKNKIIDQIDALDIEQHFEKLMKNGSSQEKLKEKRVKLYKLMKSAAEKEIDNIEKLSALKEDTKKELMSLYSREKSLKGYHGNQKFEAKFFDEKT